MSKMSELDIRRQKEEALNKRAQIKYDLYIRRIVNACTELDLDEMFIIYKSVNRCTDMTFTQRHNLQAMVESCRKAIWDSTLGA